VEVSYDEMLEMAASGAKVLTLRAVEIARNHGVCIHARSTFSDEPGTLVHAAEGVEQPAVSAVTHSLDEVVFAVRGLPERAGSAAAILDAVAAEQVNVDIVFQDVGNEEPVLSFSVASEDAPAVRGALDRATETIEHVRIEEISGLGQVSLVGAGMRSRPGVAAHVFRTLADEAIGLRFVSTSPIKIACTIARADVERAVRALHAAFELGHAPRPVQTG
jgi:aspartate kinase